MTQSISKVAWNAITDAAANVSNNSMEKSRVRSKKISSQQHSIDRRSHISKRQCCWLLSRAGQTYFSVPDFLGGQAKKRGEQNQSQCERLIKKQLEI